MPKISFLPLNSPKIAGLLQILYFRTNIFRQTIIYGEEGNCPLDPNFGTTPLASTVRLYYIEIETSKANFYVESTRRPWRCVIGSVKISTLFQNIACTQQESVAELSNARNATQRCVLAIASAAFIAFVACFLACVALDGNHALQLNQQSPNEPMHHNRGFLRKF